AGARPRPVSKPVPCFAEISAALEHLAQQVVGGAEADRPCAQRVRRAIIGPQPRRARAPPERRLVDGGREAGFRAGGQRARVARPGDIEKLARAASQARDLDMAAKPGEGPIERTREPGHATLVTHKRGAAPLMGAGEKPAAANADA